MKAAKVNFAPPIPTVVGKNVAMTFAMTVVSTGRASLTQTAVQACTAVICVVAKAVSDTFVLCTTNVEVTNVAMMYVARVASATLVTARTDVVDITVAIVFVVTVAPATLVSITTAVMVVSVAMVSVVRTIVSVVLVQFIRNVEAITNTAAGISARKEAVEGKKVVGIAWMIILSFSLYCSLVVAS